MDEVRMKLFTKKDYHIGDGRQIELTTNVDGTIAQRGQTQHTAYVWIPDNKAEPTIRLSLWQGASGYSILEAKAIGAILTEAVKLARRAKTIQKRIQT